MTYARINKRWTPRHWAGLMPFGLGRTRPNNYWELVRAAWESRRAPLYAWRILTRGVCDGCALGTTGVRDWTLEGVHLCNIRLRLLGLNTMGPLDPALLAEVGPLRALTGAGLRGLGRLPFPMLRRKGEAGFRRITWEDALERIAVRLRATDPARMGFYVTSRGMPNEAYYAAQKAARAIGTGNIENAARVCHAPSSVALKAALGVAASTCSYSDWIESDLLVFIGSNVANNQPVATKYLHHAKKNGAKIAVVNSCREPGMERYWIPSIMESAVFGTRLADRFFMVDQGGDAAFLTGVLKALIARGAVDEGFINRATTGYAELLDIVEAAEWPALEAAGGSSRSEMEALAAMLADARRAVFIWSMGITQHARGVDNVAAIVNLALAGGWIGREGCGVVPIRGHSGVQGGAEMGCYATALPGGLAVTPENAAELSARWGFEVPSVPGITAPEMLDAAGAGGMDALVSIGGNFLEVLPDPNAVEAALARVPLRVHFDIVLSSQMFVEPGDEVILLPAATRYETPGGVTETSTERRVIFSPEIPGPRIGEARPEWEVMLELARRTRPELAHRLDPGSTAALRTEIASIIPAYEGIANLSRQGDAFQIGGRLLCVDGHCPTSDGRARFTLVVPGIHAGNEGLFRVATRRGKQFNSMIHEDRDPLNNAPRDAILMNPADAARLGFSNGDAAMLRSRSGVFSGRIHLAPVTPGNLQIHWPEGNALIDGSQRDLRSGVPDYNALASVEKPF